MSNTPLKINQSQDYIVGMGILWFILRLEALFRVACKSFKACWLQDGITLHLGYGANKGHAMKHKSGKRKSGKRSFKPLEISFSWFKAVFLMNAN